MSPEQQQHHRDTLTELQAALGLLRRHLGPMHVVITELRSIVESYRTETTGDIP